MNLVENINEFKSDNFNSFKEFYDSTYKLIFFVSLSILSDEQDAEDVVQDTYMSFLNHIKDINFKSEIEVKSYLSTISKNKCLNYLKKEKRHVNNDELIKNVEGTNSKLNKILSLLDDGEEKEIIVYIFVLKYKLKDISKITKMPISTVYSKYKKAIKILKERVGDIYEYKRH